jgi:NTE family protein
VTLAERWRRLRLSRSRLNLAMQGGGAHGAFTWGVLDALLDDPSLRCERWSRAASIRRRGAGFAFGDVPSFGLLMPNERA